MTKTVATYWNPLAAEADGRWSAVPGLEGIAEEVLLSIDPETAEYTKLTRFLPGADTTPFGPKSHAYPEEVFIVSGRLFDAAFDLWLEQGHYASRRAFEAHGPFKTDNGAVVLEVSFPNRVGEAQRSRLGGEATSDHTKAISNSKSRSPRRRASVAFATYRRASRALPPIRRPAEKT